MSVCEHERGVEGRKSQQKVEIELVKWEDQHCSFHCISLYGHHVYYGHHVAVTPNRYILYFMVLTNLFTTYNNLFIDLF